MALIVHARANQIEPIEFFELLQVGHYRRGHGQGGGPLLTRISALLAAPKNAGCVVSWVTHYQRAENSSKRFRSNLCCDALCLLLAQSGHATLPGECLLLGVKRTLS
jgi:hypothetical protein